MSHKVLYYTLEGNIQRARQILDEMGVSDQIELTGVGHEAYSSPSEQELEGMEAVITELTPIDTAEADLMDKAGIRIVASMSIGINHMDVEELEKMGIWVTNCPGYCAEDVALHAIAMTLDLERQITYGAKLVEKGGWDPRTGYKMRRISGQTMGLVFFGHIGREVAPLAKGLGMDVVVWAPTKTEEYLASFGCRKAETLDELLVQSDVVSLHCPLIPETRDLIGARELSLMKPTAFLINTARGELIDEDALADALDSGTIAAAALDVMRNEAGPRSERLISNPRCVITPHSAYLSEEADDNLRKMSLRSVCDLLIDGRKPSNAVNNPSSHR
ncbi:MAG: C-terminal binding protein [Coriobacteriales bacterium]|jgi:phosphoglycerate dehydrogenase-like enzyme